MTIHQDSPPLTPDELIDLARQGGIGPQDEITDEDRDDAAVARLLLAAAKLRGRTGTCLDRFGELAEQAFVYAVQT